MLRSGSGVPQPATIMRSCLESIRFAGSQVWTCLGRQQASNLQQVAVLARSLPQIDSPSTTSLLIVRNLLRTSGSAPSKKFSQRRLVGYSPEQLYTVISQVEDYHQFVPWVQKSQVVKKIGDEYLEAELVVGFQVLVERYTSQVYLERPKLVRSTVSNSTLFHHLESNWAMEPGVTPASCWLNFSVDFAFKSQLYGHLADVFFSEVVKQMVNAFEGRCATLYGPSSFFKPKHHGHHPHHPDHGSRAQDQHELHDHKAHDRTCNPNLPNPAPKTS